MATRWTGGVVLAAALALVVPLGAPPAEAASCSSLRAQLASGDRAGEYERAAARQRSELATTRGMAARAGCARRDTAQCTTLTSTIAAMQTRIGQLDRQARRGSASARASLKRQIERQCSAGRSAKAAPARKAPARAASSAAASTTKPRLPARSSVASPRAPGVPTGGSYRTVCVRTCDGYFFPVSNAVGPQSFATDTKRCAAMCPRAETRLYAHARSGDATTMFDRTGTLYSARPYAFGHTREGYRPSPACTCGRPLAPRPSASLRGSTEPVPTPLGMAPPEGDAETRRNAGVEFGWRQARDIVRTGTADRANGDAGVGPRATPARAVRVVGPAFLPDR